MKISLVGRTNVGKSSLFNAIIKKKFAITLDIAGTTRDYQEANIKIDNIDCTVIDTGGFETKNKFIWNVTEKAIKKSDILMFVVSAKDGLSIEDYECAKFLRKYDKHIVLIVNKADKSIHKYDLGDFYSLGFENIIFTSCKNNSGISDILDLIVEHFDKISPESENLLIQDDCTNKQDDDSTENSLFHYSNENIDEVQEKTNEQEIKIAIIGRPNAGKSTILNGILGEERVLTSPIAGTTRDSIHTKFSWKGSKFEIIDTAGIRKKNKHGDDLEIESVKMARQSIKLANVVLVVIDCCTSFDKQDLTLVSFVIDQGKIPILVFNKWDLVQNKDEFLFNVEHKVSVNFSQITGMECIFISAIDSKQKYGQLFLIASKLYERSLVRVSTGLVNRILREAEEKHSPPRVNGKKLRVKYGLQASYSPHKFIFFFSQDPSRVPSQYLVYLRNFFAEKLQLYGLPIFINAKCSENPYVKN